MIKFLDLKEFNARFENDFIKAHANLLDSGWYILGNNVKQFESNYANYCDTKYCVGVGNGLDALVLIFKSYIALGRLNKGDEVIVPANTFIASILAVLHSDLKPVFVEPKRNTFNISASEISKAITSKTKAILAVHLYGQIADMDAINSIAKQNELLVIEDAAQAHGAVNERGEKAGNLSDAGAFSFYPAKNLGALGDGGAITTNDEDLVSVLKKMRNYGTSTKYVNDIIGYNSRLDELQAAFLDIKLKKLDDDNNKRMFIAKQYLEQVNSKNIELPYWSSKKDHVFHQFVIRVKNRQHFVEYMKANNVETLIHYPIAPHKQKALSKYSNLALPITEEIHENVVSVPLNPILSQDQINTIIKLLNAY